MKRPILTREQRLFSYHQDGCFLQACPGSGKTRAIVGRICRISGNLLPRKGIAVLSFTNTAVHEFKERCHAMCLGHVLRHPGFVGTFDAFVRHFIVLPSGIPGIDARPIIVDSWNSLGIDVRLRGRNAFRGNGVSLDNFDSLDGSINPSTIGHAGLRAHVQNHRADYEQAAMSRRHALQNKGYISAADARVMAIANLAKDGWADSLGMALAARFEEIIIDEAQDCNYFDLALLEWLKECGLSVTIVCDPDQAIYGFRQGSHDPDQLQEFAATYDNANRLYLTGNFRSSAPICSIAATLRSRADPDDALGEHGANNTPVQIFVYSGAAVSPAIGSTFSELAAGQRIKPEQAFILAHKRRAALQAAGQLTGSALAGTSKVAIIASAIGSFWASAGSNRARETALRDVERLLLQLMRKIDASEPVPKATERNEIDSRWLRRTALELVTRLPAICDDTDAGRAVWLAALHKAVRQCDLEYAEGVTETNFFARRGRQDWNQLLQPASALTIRCATVHEAKGREYDAVCLVIPPNRVPLNHTEQLFAAWEHHADDEAKRVAYVGITRAKKLVSVAVPAAYRDRFATILDGARVPWILHKLD